MYTATAVMFPIKNHKLVYVLNVGATINTLVGVSKNGEDGDLGGGYLFPAQRLSNSMSS